MILSKSLSEDVAVVFGLLLFAQLGVLSRIYLDWLFSCDSHEGSCVTSDGTALFSDLFTNMLGSFIIGFVAGTKQLGVQVGGDRQIAVLPLKHPWQKNSVLQTAIRTGYCGCLTTYATWQLDLIQMIIGAESGSTLWLQAVAGYFIGLYCSVMSLIVGEHFATFLATRCSCLSKTLAPSQQLNSVDDFQNTKDSGVDFIDKQRNQQQSQAIDNQQQSKSQKHRKYVQNGEYPSQQMDLEMIQQEQQSEKQVVEQNTQFNTNQKQFSNDTERVEDIWGPLKTPINIIMGILGMGLFAVMIYLIVVEQEHTPRYYWFATAFGPFGCILRWKLSRLNFKIKSAAWLPFGTFLANQLACIIDFIIEVVLLKVTGMSTVVGAALGGMKTGFAGSLSTVSTWVTEIRNACKQLPDSFVCYWYTVLTIGTSIILGILIYGIPYWTHS